MTSVNDTLKHMGDFMGDNSSLSRPDQEELPIVPRPGPQLPSLFAPIIGDVLVSKEIFDIVEMVINIYLIIPIAVVGSAGNIISIVILSINGFKTSSNVILVSMAIADLLILLTMPLRKISLIFAYFDKVLAISVSNYVVSYHFLTLNRVWSLISNSHVAIVSVERLLAVYCPFKIARWLTVPRMVAFVVFTHVIWYVALIPLFTMFDVMWIYEPSLNQSIPVPSITDFYLERENQFNDYNSYFLNITIGAILLSLTLTCCTAIAIKIKKMGQKRKLLIENVSSQQSKKKYMRTESVMNVALSTTDEQPNVQNSQHNIKSQNDNSSELASSTNVPAAAASRVDMKAVRMLMVVCVTFLVLIFPTFFLAFFQGLFPQLREPYWHRVNFLVTSVSMLLIAINSSVNFIIYIFFSQKFHQTFIDIFTCKSKKKITK